MQKIGPAFTFSLCVPAEQGLPQGYKGLIVISLNSYDILPSNKPFSYSTKESGMHNEFYTISLSNLKFIFLQSICLTFSRPAEPQEGEKKKLWRKIWEISHKFTGRTALILGLINISLGMFLSLASKALWITWFAYLGMVIIAYVIAEIWSRRKAKKMKIGHDDNVAM